MKPIHAVDVGAARGIQKQWLPYLDYLQVSAFEPYGPEWLRLCNTVPKNVSVFPVALAETSGRREFHVLKTPSGSSLLKPNMAFREYWTEDYIGLEKTILVDCKSFADFRKANGLPAPELLKLDTQGTEGAILAGFWVEDWQALQAVKVEVSFVELYHGQMLFPELHAMLTNHGLTLMDLKRGPYSRCIDKPDVCPFFHGDALYFRLRDNFEDRTELARYLLICEMYKFTDQIVYLTRKYRDELSCGDRRPH